MIQKTFFSKNLSSYLKNEKISIKKFSKKTEIEESLIRDFSTGKKEPSLEILVRIAGAINISTDRLLKYNPSGVHPKQRRKQIKLLVMDVDGVMTDGGMYYTESGDEFKKFNAKDGIAIRKLSKSGIKTGFLSSGDNKQLIEKRANVLGVHFVYAGREPKTLILEQWTKKLNLSYSNIAYIGDDINDIEVIEKAGLSACPADAVQKIKDKAFVILKSKGGKGCVREFVEKYLLDL